MRSLYKEYKVVEEYTYRLLIGREALGELREVLDKLGVRPGLAVIAKPLSDWASVLEEQGFKTKIMDDGEENKSLETVLRIIEALRNIKADRWTAVAVVSGGSLGDTVSFAASIYLRGLPLIQVPTTLLAMVDSSIGGKTAVNVKGLKNVIGTFYHPWVVVDDLNFLDTLPDEVYRSGFAEVFKYAFTLDPSLLELLEDISRSMGRDEELLVGIISRSAELKLKVVSMDPLERRGVREVLNFGHTIGHAIESGSKFSILHGEAVALGMVCESKMSEKILGFKQAELVKNKLESFGLLKSVEVDEKKFVEAIMSDKKRKGENIRMPLLRELGKWELVEVPVKTVVEEGKRCLEELL